VKLTPTIAILFLAAVLFYAPLIGWGVPQATAPDRTKTFATDEILPLEGLAEMHNTFVVSKPDRNYGYPWWHYFMTAAAQGPYLVYARLTGNFGSPSPDYPFGFRDPVAGLRWLTLTGRFLSVLMGASIVVAAFLFGRNFWGYAAGLLAAVLTLLNYLMVYYSRTGNLDVPVTFWTSLGLVVFSAIATQGMTTRRGGWLGVFTALALATKDQAVLVFLPLGLVLLWWERKKDAPAWRPYGVALGVSLAVYLVATGMLVDPHRHYQHVYATLFKSSSLNSMWFYRPGQPKTWAGTLGMYREFFQGLLWTSSPPVVVLALAGAWATLRKAPRRLILLVPVVLIFVGLMLPARTLALRYFLPTTIILCGFAAYGISELTRARLRWALIPLIGIACGWELAVAADLTYAQVHETRLAAAEWIGSHVRPGQHIEYFGVREAMPPLPAEIPTRRIAGRVEWKMESGHGPRILQYLAAEGPEYVFITPDVTSKPGVPFSGDCPPEVYYALLQGRTNYTQAAYFPTPSILPAWFRRPRLDYPTVAPPVWLFARKDVAQ
jgi:Dolichyl-phosphate-mannose-protein mannosyltransferase